MFSREQYEQLRSFPEISRDELFRYFTLTPGVGHDVQLCGNYGDPCQSDTASEVRP